MDLKIKDLSELLSVSEKTIRRWLTEGKIPAYKLNHQYRFSRIEIENWMMSCKLKPENPSFTPFPQEEQIYPQEEPEAIDHPLMKGGNQQFSLYRAIHRGDAFAHIAGTTKEEIIRATMKHVAPKLGLDADVLSDLLLDREKLMPTALNNGIGVPHTRDFLIQGPSDMIFVVYPQKPIEYGALDGNPVHTLFFLFSSADKRHLHLLAKLAHLGSSPESLEMVRTKPSKEKLLEYLKEWEAKIGIN